MELLKEEARSAENALVEECQNGDPAAFDELVTRYKDRIYNVVYRFLGNHEDAQDVAQEVFIRAFKGIQDFKGEAKVYTWLYSIAGNLARNKLRDASRKGRNKATSLEALEAAAPGVAQGLTASVERPDESARRNEINEALQASLEELPEHYRMAFVLRTFEQLSYDEIADAMDCPRGTVKSRLNHARKFLHERLKERSIL